MAYDRFLRAENSAGAGLQDQDRRWAVLLGGRVFASGGLEGLGFMAGGLGLRVEFRGRKNQDCGCSWVMLCGTICRARVLCT